MAKFLHSSSEITVGIFSQAFLITYKCTYMCIYVSVQFSHSVMSNSLRPHELQDTRPPCPSPTLRVYPNPCPLSQWFHPTISSSVIPFSSCPQSFPASGSFQMNQLFASGGQSTGASASTSVLPMNTQDWSPLGWINAPINVHICVCVRIYIYAHTHVPTNTHTHREL